MNIIWYSPRPDAALIWLVISNLILFEIEDLFCTESLTISHSLKIYYGYDVVRYHNHIYINGGEWIMIRCVYMIDDDDDYEDLTDFLDDNETYGYISDDDWRFMT